MAEQEVAARLLAERAAAAEHLATLSAELAAVEAAAARSNLDDEHDPEGSTVAFEREQLAVVRTDAQQRVLELDAALERLRGGRYGRCDSCGSAVGAERLDALPATRLCVGCAGRGQRRTSTSR